jgi:hypothetical protein
MTVPVDYRTPGVFTALTGVPASALRTEATGPVELCRPVHLLVLQPDEAADLGLPDERLAARNVRPAAALVRSILSLDPRPLAAPRPPGDRVVGTCRHFAVLACALLRHSGVRARVRCGFATYFQAGRGLDHWITEYWEDATATWVRIDSEIIGGTVLSRPERLAEGQFLTGGEAWRLFRSGSIDASEFGVPGTENWGPSEIRGNAVRDLACLNNVEMLPWDEWGLMTDAYDGKTGEDYDLLLDQLATACASDDPAAIAELYGHPHFRVPAGLID